MTADPRPPYLREQDRGATGSFCTAKPEVESLRMALSDEKERNARLTAAYRDLDKRLKASATAVLDVLEERDSLRDSLSRRERLVPVPMSR